MADTPLCGSFESYSLRVKIAGKPYKLLRAADSRSFMLIISPPTTHPCLTLFL